MPTFQITAPDGKKYKITAPEGTSQDQALAYFQSNYKPGPKMEGPGASEMDPTAGMSGGEKFLTGIGKGMVDVGRGIGQLAGVYDRKDIDEAKAIDAPLMNTGAGKAGAVTGAVASVLPTAWIPGVNSYTGAAALGGITGFLQPVGTDDSRTSNAIIGTVGGAAGQAAGNLIAAGVRGGKAMLAPFFESGRKEIAARMLQQTAADPAKAASDALTYKAATAGVRPTLAEATLDPGLASLERSFNSGGHAAGVAAQKLDNRSALVQALRDIGKDDAAMASAAAYRGRVTEPLYQGASPFGSMMYGAKMTDGGGDLMVNASKEQVKKLASLASRPSMQEADKIAMDLAAEEGITLGPELTQQKLHYLKMAMDKMLNPQSGSGIVGAQADAVRATRNALVDWMESNLSHYGPAKTAYRELTKPINQMEIGQYLTNKLVPALSESGDSLARLRPSQYAESLRNADQMARQATDFKGATLKSIMTPEQMTTLEGVGKDLAREQLANEVGRSAGSNTAQNLGMQNLSNQILGPMGLPGPVRSVAEAILQAPNRLGLPVFKGSDDEIRAMMAELLRDPKKAAQALGMSPTVGNVERLADILRRTALPVTLGTQAGQQ